VRPGGWHTSRVPDAVPQISRDELRQRIDSGVDFVLVDAMGPVSFAKSHLPGAVNITPEWIDERARHRIRDLDTAVVVYCAGPDCDSSVIVADRLVELGYRNVRHYSGGKRDWEEAGLPFEAGRPHPAFRPSATR
jgi:rhodanese-related sulfurtransferase